MTTKSLKMFERFIHANFIDVLRISPMDSLTPFQVGEQVGEQEEFIFIGKLSPYIYEPFKGRSLSESIPIEMAMYNEGDNLIVHFDTLGVQLETEIRAEVIRPFLSTLAQQEKITIAILDGYTYDLVWLTNTIPFRAIRHHFQEIFEGNGIELN